MAALALDSFDQRANTEAERLAEGVERLGVDLRHDGLPHELRERLARDARQSGQGVGGEVSSGGHLLKLPAYRHGGSVTLTVALDKRKRIAYYSAHTNRST